MRPGAPAVAVVDILKARATAEAKRPVVQPSGKVPALLAEVNDDPVVEATLTVLSLCHDLSSWPGLPAVTVLGISEARLWQEQLWLQRWQGWSKSLSRGGFREESLVRSLARFLLREVSFLQGREEGVSCVVAMSLS